MDPDDAAQARRPSTAHDRPSRAPFGPRRPKHPQDQPDSPTARPHTPPHADAAVQAPASPTHSPQRPAPATFSAPPPLAPPPAVSFESTPIPWKGLPLEAAQWSFSSAELQEIVSKAIRLSARESFVRLLSLQALEVDIVREAERLETARLAAQARWRFEVGRRTMLMHALNATAAFSSPTSGSELGEDGNPTAGFVAQLATAVASCDSLLSSILQMADQRSQIAVIQHQHWASALGMALRKLNKAHERQGQELKRAQARVQTLEDELEEAWREAEKMAIEFDDLEQEIAESEGSEILDEGAEQAAVDSEIKHDLDETGTLGDVTIHTDIAVVLGVTATAVASKATLVAPSNPKPVVDKSDTKSIRSVKSTRSRRSTRDGPTHLARLSSARTRSRAASNASLRLPKALRSTPSTHSSPVDAPPIPSLPSPTVQGDSFLDMDNAHDHVRQVPPKRHPEPKLALPTPPHSAGLPETRVPSIWLETDSGKSSRLNGVDRSRSFHIFSSFSPPKMRRSNLVMSLTGSDRSSDGIAESGSRPASGSGPASGPGSGASSAENQDQVVSSAEDLDQVAPMGIWTGARPGSATGTGTGSASPTSNHSPISLPTHALAHFRRPSLSSSSHGMGGGTGVVPRPGSAGARLTTTREETRTGLLGSPRRGQVESPRRSLVSRASSVILRRLSQATTVSTGGRHAPTATATGTEGATLGSPSKSREASRLSGGGRTLIERWKDRGKEDDKSGSGAGETEAEGEVMLIGSLHSDSSDAP